jgi:hypothetical protein
VAMTQFVIVMFFVGSTSPYGFSLFRQMASSPVWMSQLDTKTLREADIDAVGIDAVIGNYEFGFRR